MNKKLLFVYNADSALFNQLGDFIHKIISPKTYPCNLCSLTYSGASMRKDWKEFVNLLPLKNEFLHKDEFFKLFPKKQNITLPAVFLQLNNDMIEFISAKEINHAKTLEELKLLVQQNLARANYE